MPCPQRSALTPLCRVPGEGAGCLGSEPRAHVGNLPVGLRWSPEASTVSRSTDGRVAELRANGTQPAGSLRPARENRWPTRPDWSIRLTEEIARTGVSSRRIKSGRVLVTRVRRRGEPDRFAAHASRRRGLPPKPCSRPEVLGCDGSGVSDNYPSGLGTPRLVRLHTPCRRTVLARDCDLVARRPAEPARPPGQQGRDQPTGHVAQRRRLRLIVPCLGWLHRRQTCCQPERSSVKRPDGTPGALQRHVRSRVHRPYLDHQATMAPVILPWVARWRLLE